MDNNFENFNKIKLLDNTLINKIAAGEVIERPASIVKELVENAIDANAKNITIEIKNGGKSFIKIIDDGTGIKKDEIDTAFIRHATSKLVDIKDLDNILTLGFRGEALASIASISRVEMTTKTKNDDIGTQINIEGGSILYKKEVATLVGTTFIIKDIFFNIQARLKFLKKDASESSYITEIITKLALGNPNIAFKYINNTSEILSTDGSGILKNTALYVYGNEIAKLLVPIESTKNNFKLKGLIGLPEISRGNRNYCNFFINNRYIKSKLVNNATEEAYSGKLINSKFPIFILNLISPEGSVDINVHPTKLEARFENENFIYEFLLSSIQSELKKHILIPSIAISQNNNLIKSNKEFKEFDIKNNEFKEVKEFEVSKMPNIDILKEVKEVKEVKSNNIDKPILDTTPKDNKNIIIDKPILDATPKNNKNIIIDKPILDATPKDNKNIIIDKPILDVTPKDNKNIIIDKPILDVTPKNNKNISQIPISRELLTKDLSKDASFNKQDLKQDLILNQNTFFNNYKIIGQIFYTYWIIQQEADLYLIDQHSAHEKVIYEELYQSFLNSKVYSQALLQPIVLQVSSSEKQSIEDNLDLFNKFGFGVEKFGEDCYAISKVPFIFKNALSPSSFIEILDSLADDNFNNISTENPKNEKSIYNFKVEQIIMMSCKKAVKANDRLSSQEAKALIEKLLILKDPFTCPHGRPTIVKITKSEIEKFFKRI